MNLETATSTPAMVRGLDFNEYLDLDMVSNTLLKQLKVSPKQYRFRQKHPIKDRKNLMIGRGSHTSVLEPDRFPLDYVVYKGKVRRGKQWDEFAAINKGSTILKAEEYQQCLSIRDAVNHHPIARRYFKEGESEITLFWKHETTGIWCKSRLDWFKADDYLLDLKTTKSIQPWLFNRDCFNMGYHIQGAFYQDAFQAVNGQKLPYYIVAVETNAPHDVAVYAMPDEVLDEGRMAYGTLMHTLATCIEKDEWPGQAEEKELELQLPAWLSGGKKQGLKIGGEDFTFDE